MKLQMTCPKCGSDRISITSDEKDPTPLYKCAKCGYKGRLFPKFESDKNMTGDEDAEDEMEEADEDSEEELHEDEQSDQF